MGSVSFQTALPRSKRSESNRACACSRSVAARPDRDSRSRNTGRLRSSPWSLGAAETKYRHARHVAGVWDRVIALGMRAQNLRFADETFDAVISIGSFEMIGEERPNALEQMVRVAKRGARVGVAEPMCLPVPIPSDLRELDRARFSDGRGVGSHFRSVDWTAELFERRGSRRGRASEFFRGCQMVAGVQRAGLGSGTCAGSHADGGRWAALRDGRRRKAIVRDLHSILEGMG